MKTTVLRRLMALMLAALLCAGVLTGCGGSDEEESPSKTNEIVAQPGGSEVPFSEGFDTTRRYTSEVVGDTLCIAFNGIQNDNRYKVPYFTAAGDTITVNSKATVESEKNLTYRATLWTQVEGGAQYVGSSEVPGTIEFTADGQLYTAQFTGLEPGAKYKICMSYDGRGKYYMYGQLAVQGLAGAEAVAAEEDA